MFEFEEGKMVMTEIAPGIQVQEVREKTEAKFECSEKLKVMNVSS